MIIHKFDRGSCKILADKAMQALMPVAASFGLHLKKVPGRFNGNTFTMKVEFSTIDEEGVPKTGTRNDYLLFCEDYGLKREWLDKFFLYAVNGQTYKVVGLKTRSRKYPVLAEHVLTKAVFKFPAHVVKNNFKNL